MKNSSKHIKNNSLELAANPFTRIQKNLGHMLHHFYDLSDLKPFEQWEGFKLSPAIDIVEDKTCFKIEVEMPGLDESDVQVLTDENILTIIGEKSCSKKDENKNYLSREIDYGRYERNISLPPTADISKISATFKKGMLWVIVPKRDLETRCAKRKIAIQRLQ